jgi:hypothetical protein
MLKQTGGEWSAPLDDVFIHFDYARSAAEGHAFEWVPGNGFSSGNTSLSYPFALTLGYRLGFQGQDLMRWAAIVAATSVFASLLAARRLFFRDARGAPAGPGHRDAWTRLGSFLLPPVVLALGALDWSLWSGMEVAFFLATWALGLVAWDALERAPHGGERRAAVGLGLAGLAMVVTRPEAIVTVAVFAVVAAWALRARKGSRGAAGLVAIACAPAAAALLVQAVANRLLTGEWSQAGALVKLAVNNPFLTPSQKLDDYLFNLRYAVCRNVEYHFTDEAPLGPLVPALALGALAMPRTRRVATLLWLQIVGWLCVVALNGQVRWQNERYTMPAVAWLLIAAALGAVALPRPRSRPVAATMVMAGIVVTQMVATAMRPPNTDAAIRVPWWQALAIGGAGAAALWPWPMRTLAVPLALYVAHAHQETKMREQRWFFGRASRNILDQHLTAGRYLARSHPHRVLVGDAGALLYASWRPGLDLIGLGGMAAPNARTHTIETLPFARASVHGLAASIELIERIAPEERPDVMAIYPSWWGVLPTWFASAELARFAAPGNVICGGYEKVIYRADWHVLGTGDVPRVELGGLAIRDVLDTADLVSERAHGYVHQMPGSGWTDMKILADPAAPSHDLWDGGRRVVSGFRERFVLGGLMRGRTARLVVRTAQDANATVVVRVGGREVARATWEATDGWRDRVLDVPGESVSEAADVEIASEGPGDVVDYHVWIAQ